MYNIILLAVALQRWDRYSAHALAARAVAVALAHTPSKQLHVLSVYDYERLPTTSVPPAVAARFREEEHQRTDSLMVRRMDEYVAPLEAAGLTPAKILRAGNPREIIVEVARNIQADLLVIGSHSRRGLLDVTLGGTAQQVARHAPCTVVLVSPKR